DIQKELNDIKNAVYGREVRGSIHDGIKKINDEVEVATDLSESAKHQAENIQQQVNQLVVEGDSSVEAAQARVDADGNTFTTLKERLDTKETQFASQLAQTEQEINELPAQVASTNLNAFWEPPTQPHMDEVAPPTPIHPSSVFNLYDDLMSIDPTYISKEILGKDFTGLYDIPRYILK